MNKEPIIYKTRTAFGQSENIGVYALASVVNSLEAEGAGDYSVSVKLLLPPDAEKRHMYAVKKNVKNMPRTKYTA